MACLILSHSRFIHVPKTGGSWVCNVVKRLCPCYLVVGRRQMGTASTLDPLSSHVCLAGLPGETLFTFAFVRHPVSWWMSAFRHKWTTRWKNMAVNVPRTTQFSKFMDAVLTTQPGCYSASLERFVGHRDSEIDFVGKHETLCDDLIMALRLAGERVDEQALRNTKPRNVSKPVHCNITTALARRIESAEAEAMERFTYTPWQEA